MNHGPLDEPTARGLKALQDRIAASKIPPSQLDESITLATWNIRELGKKPRKPAALHYIAEIIGMFDLVAIVEVRDNMADLSTVLSYLGPYWKVIFTDFLADSPGNRERMAYVYDERAVQFTGLASHASPPRKKNEAGPTAQGTSPACHRLVAPSFRRVLPRRQLRLPALHRPHPVGRRREGPHPRAPAPRRLGRGTPPREVRGREGRHRHG